MPLCARHPIASVYLADTEGEPHVAPEAVLLLAADHFNIPKSYPARRP